MLKRSVNTGPPISETDISSFESKIRAVLPNEYRQFLLQFNGGIFSCAIYGSPSNKISSFTIYLYTLDENAKALNLYRNYIMFLGRMPKGVIPIGENEAGDRFCLVVDKNSAEYGTVWDWNRKYELKDRNPLFKNNMLKRFKCFADLFKILDGKD